MDYKAAYEELAAKTAQRLEKYKENNRKKYEKHKDVIKQRAAEYYNANKEEINRKKREARAAVRERCLLQATPA
jgi:hypothetical protein